MTKYFTSDTHWGHRRIIQYSNRPFTSVEEMDLALIKNWNTSVGPDDHIYHLGDFAFATPSRIDWILSQLNGHKHFIYGNHDETIAANKSLQDHFESVNDYLEIKIGPSNDQHKTILCHFPMITWNKAHRGSFMLHGHCHGSLRYPFKARIMDVGVDPIGMFPISEHEVVRRLKNVEMQVVDHHGE